MSADDGASEQTRPTWPEWRFGEPLEQLEQTMLRNAAAGEVTGPDGPFDLAEMKGWGKERMVRAAVLRHLLITDDWPVDPKGVRLRWVRITGHLDLEGATIRCPLYLDSCYLDASEPANFDMATASLVILTECHLAGLEADGLTAKYLTLSQCTFDGRALSGVVRLGNAHIAGQLDCTGAILTGRDTDGDALFAEALRAGNVVLDGVTVTAGAIRLLGADITGRLSCSGAKLAGCDQAGNALAADGIKVGGGASLLGLSVTQGEVRLINANIAGQLDCRGAKLHAAYITGSALVADRIKVGGGVLLTEGFTAAGTVRLLGADIGGELDCSGAELLAACETGDALAADGIKVSGDVFLSDGFTAAGTVWLREAEIAGWLNCAGAHLSVAAFEGYALIADGMKVGASVFLTDGFTAAGTVRLPDARIVGQLDCSGAQLTVRGKDRNALVADRIKVGGSVFLTERFTAAGAVRLISADITGQLSCANARLNPADGQGDALIADRIRVSGPVILTPRFIAAGTVRLLGADITGQLNCVGAQLKPPRGRHALRADSIRVGGDVFLTNGFTATRTISLGSAQIAGQLCWEPAAPIEAKVDLKGATVGALTDRWTLARHLANGYWPTEGRLVIDGLTYGSINPDDVGQRLSWIRSQHTPKPIVPWTGEIMAPPKVPQRDSTVVFATQPYEQLADVYRRAGQDAQARKVAIARRADQRKYGNLSPYRWIGNWLLDKTIKYGYQTWRAGAGLATLFVTVWVLSAIAQQHHLMVPVGDIVVGLHPVPSATKCSSNYPCFYPAGYAADTVIPLINVHQAEYWGPDGHAPWGHAWVVGTWIATGLGWALATLLVAGYTGLVRKD